jgi:guanylate kinase
MMIARQHIIKLLNTTSVFINPRARQDMQEALQQRYTPQNKSLMSRLENAPVPRLRNTQKLKAG